MQEIVVDSDLEVRMQQDDSRNPSVIYTIFTDNLIKSSYTSVNGEPMIFCNFYDILRIGSFFSEYCSNDTTFKSIFVYNNLMTCFISSDNGDHIFFRFAGYLADFTSLSLSDDKMHMQCLSESTVPDHLCGLQALNLPPLGQFTPRVLFKGATFRPRDGSAKHNVYHRSRYTWAATRYRVMGRMADCDWMGKNVHPTKTNHQVDKQVFFLYHLS